jgi:hypothetical protein
MLDGGNSEISGCVILLFVNLVCDSEEIRNFFTTSELYNKILDLAMKQTVNNTYSSNVAILIRNLHKQSGYVEHDANVSKKSTTLICRYLKLHDGEIFLDCLYALDTLTYFENTSIFKIIADSGVIEMLIEVMRNNMGNEKIKSAFLKLIGNFSSFQSDFTMNYLINLNVFDIVAELLNDTLHTVRRLTCWIFSNVAASEDHINFLIDKGYLDKIKQMLTDDDITVVTEAVWFISNMINCSNLDMKAELVTKFSILQALVYLLYIDNEKIIILALDTLKSIFHANKMLNLENTDFSKNLFANYFIELGGVDILGKLQGAGREKIDLEVDELIEEYFSCPFKE